MAINIKPYLNGDKTYYQVDVDYRDSIGKRRQKRATGFETMAEARKAGPIVLQKLIERVQAKERLGNSWKQLVYEFGEYLQQDQAASGEIRQTTAIDTIRTLELYTEEWIDRPASTITPGDVQDTVKSVERKGRSYSRAKALKNALSKLFDWAISRRKIPGMTVNPAKGFKMGRKQRSVTEGEILTIKQIQFFLASAKRLQHPWYPIWYLAIATGMRSGELHALRFSDVDFEARIIRLERAYCGRFKTDGPTKNGKSRRIYINDELMTFLKELRATAQGRPHVLPRISKWTKGEAAKVTRTFLESIGLPSIRFHALRACFATHLLGLGIPAVIVQAMCGWSDDDVTRRYIRDSGHELKGTTDGLKLLTPDEVMGTVVNLYAQHKP